MINLVEKSPMNRVMYDYEIAFVLKRYPFHNTKFMGVFNHDTIPKVFFSTKPKYPLPTCVINNKDTNDPSGGEHWLALVKLPSGHTYTFDSFGRKENNPSINLPTTWEHSPIQYQSIMEQNCGERCIVFLILYDKLI